MGIHWSPIKISHWPHFAGGGVGGGSQEQFGHVPDTVPGNGQKKSFSQVGRGGGFVSLQKHSG